MGFSFSVNGLENLHVDLATWSAIDPSDILNSVVLPAAEYLRQEYQKAAMQLLNVVSGSLSSSIRILRKGVYSWGVSATVGPNQGRHPKSSQGKRHPRAQGGGGGNYQGTNAEVAFILEYGSARIQGRHWMETACTRAEPGIFAIMENAFYELLEKLRAA